MNSVVEDKGEGRDVRAVLSGEASLVPVFGFHDVTSSADGFNFEAFDRRHCVAVLRDQTQLVLSVPRGIWAVYSRMPETGISIATLRTWTDDSDEDEQFLEDIVRVLLRFQLCEPSYVGADHLTDRDFEHFKRQFAYTQLFERPFPHAFVEDVFPALVYERLIRLFPRLADMHQLMTGYPERYAKFLYPVESGVTDWQSKEQKVFWDQVTAWLTSDSFRWILLTLFGQHLEERFRNRAEPSLVVQAYLCQDHKGYSIRPHTGHLRKVVSIKFNLPKGREFESFGTRLYTPKNDIQGDSFLAHRVLERPGQYQLSTRHEFDDFEEAKSLKFSPNSAFCFVHTEAAYHGVPKIGLQFERNALQFSLLIENLDEVYPDFEVSREH